MPTTFCFRRRNAVRDASKPSTQTGIRSRVQRCAIESLEPRQFLCAGPLDIGTAAVLVASDHGPIHAPLRVAATPAFVDTHRGDPGYLTTGDRTGSDLAVRDAATGTSTLATATLHPLTSIPPLHSYPSARVKLYLDFDGYTDGTTTIPVYDRDADPTTFSDSELDLINKAWAKVSEDYLPFNIDVTTVEPPELAPGVPESVANGVALRVAFGGDGSWTGGKHGGIANIGAFSNTAANTVFVFPANTGSGMADGDVASHEAGHGFSLLHQSSYDSNGVKTNEYNQGAGNWAPIMGNTYLPVTTWYNGTSSSGPTDYQDDMAVLAGTTNGFGYRADDVGDTVNTATVMAFDGSSYTGSGIIGTNTDVDAWSFTATNQDTYHISVAPAAFGPNLDAVLQLRDAAGELLATASPTLSQAADLLLPLMPGTYFLMATKTAAYGWLGSYTLTVTTPPAGVTASAPKTLVTSEGGPAVTFTLALNTQPNSDVTFPIASSNLSEGTVTPDNITFTPANWNVPQSITVMGVSDNVRDDDVAYSIVLGSAASSDVEYSGLELADISAMNLDNSFSGYLYSDDPGNGRIQRTTLQGTAVETLVDLQASNSSSSSLYLDIDPTGGKVYWTDAGTGLIQRANLDGSSLETVLSGFTGGGLRSIGIDSAAGKMYWLDFATQKIQRANLDGTGVQDLVTGVAGGRGLALDVAGGKMYWSDISSRTVSRANLDGSNVQLLWTGDGVALPYGIDVDRSGGKVYWSDAGVNQRILRANLDGSNVQTLLDTSTLSSASSLVRALRVDSRAGKIYLSDRTNKVIYRANLDGSAVVPVDTGDFSLVQGIAILAPSATVLPNGGLVTSETGGKATFQVALNVAPRANVTIPVSSSNTQEGTVSASSLTFTPANWNVPQTVTVSGFDDTLVDGNKTYVVVLSAAVSTDANYNGVDPRDVSVINRDNESKFLVVDDATTNLTYRYGIDGTARGNSTLSSSNSAPRGVASSLVGDKYWVVDQNRSVYVYSSSGSLLGSWIAGTLANNASPTGIATNGADVWIVDSRSDKVFRYAGAASLLSGTQSAANSFSLNNANANATDIVTDGQSFWTVDDTAKSDKVFRYSLTGNLLGSWTIDAANKTPTGIAIDPMNVNHVWIVDSGTDKVYQYNGAASKTSGVQAAAFTFALAPGNANPQGIADPPIRQTPESIVDSLHNWSTAATNMDHDGAHSISDPWPFNFGQSSAVIKQAKPAAVDAAMYQQRLCRGWDADDQFASAASTLKTGTRRKKTGTHGDCLTRQTLSNGVDSGFLDVHLG